MKNYIQTLFRHSRGHPPYAVANVIGDKQCACPVDRHANRTAQSITLRTDKAGEYILRCPGRMSVDERHKNHFVTTPRLTVPGAVLTDECPARKALRQ